MTPPDDGSYSMADAGTRRRHAMPYGAQIEEDGSVRFQLWAPSVPKVALALEDGDIAMDLLVDGWWNLTTKRAAAGTRYRFRIDDGSENGLLVPDPASRFQPDDVAGASVVIDPSTHLWRDDTWRGRRWEEAVIYELHVGTFTPNGTFAGVIEKLDALVSAGITAIELMPIGDFPGRRNWGYDGVLPYAPDSSYGTPEDLKRLIEAAHTRGLMVFLDVVYNHFGPEGNYLPVYAKPFFTDRHQTPWGAAIDFSGPQSRPVRSFFVHNALYWLLEYNIDGLRLDAVHAIYDELPLPLLDMLAAEIHAAIPHDRQVHLVLENDDNRSDLLRRDGEGRPTRYTAQWNDDAHHALHVLLTGETTGYYEDYADRPIDHLARCLSEGFAYQGDVSKHRDDLHRGQPSTSLTPGAFVNFLQNHDQIGNRAFGERIADLVPEPARALAQLVLLLSPFPPLLFMGEEWDARDPFLFFCDFPGDLGEAVREGRRREFGRFAEFSDPAARARIPDPLAEETFELSRLDWRKRDKGSHRVWLDRTKKLLDIRARQIVPLLASGWLGASAQIIHHRGLSVEWRFSAGTLRLLANFSDAPLLDQEPPRALTLAECGDAGVQLVKGRLPHWAGAILLTHAAG